LFAAWQVAICPLAQAADVRVLSPSSLRAPLVESARTFARAGGHRVEFVFASVGAVHKRVATGERADVAIGTLEGTDALVRLGRAVDGSRAPLVRSALALVAPKHAAALDVGDAAALGAALRRAQALVLPDAALGVPGGAQVAELLERLELENELRDKSHRVADAREVVRRVASGAADIGIARMSDVVASGEVTAIGPLLDPPTNGIAYAAVVVRASTQADIAHAFIAHLRSPGAGAEFRKAGYLPLD
jgi:molybdate transport system substrate-binding protein